MEKSVKTNLDSFIGRQKIDTQNLEVKFWLREIEENRSYEEITCTRVHRDRAFKKILNRLKEKSKNQLDFDNLDFEYSFVNNWILETLEHYNDIDERVIQNLTEIFRKSLNTSSKKKGNSIMIMQFRDKFLLALSKQSISIVQKEGELNVVKRALDEQNVLRYIFFEKLEDKINVKVFEKYNKTKGMTELLGISPENIGWEQLGDIKVYFDWDGLRPCIEILEENILEMFNSNRLNKSENQLIHKGDIYDVHRIDMGHREINNLTELWNIVLKYRHKLQRYIDFYKNNFEQPKITESICRFKESKTEIIKIKPDEDKEIIFKKDHPYLDIVFTRQRNPPIKMKKSYFNKFYYALFNNESDIIRCFHVQGEYSEKPLKINRLEIYNKPKIQKTEKIVNLINEIITESFQSEDKKNLASVRYTALHLCKTLFYKGMSNVFTEMLKEKVIENLNFQFQVKKFDAREQYIEYKRNQWYDPSPCDFAEKLAEYIEKSPKSFQIILVGADEITKTLEPISYFKDEFADTIEKRVNEITRISKIHVHRIPHNTQSQSILLIYYLK